VAVSTYADDFLGGDHEFKFGVSYDKGMDETTSSGGIRGRYFYRYVYTYTYDYYGYEYDYDYEYFYRTTAAAYTYGSENETISGFIDDSWQTLVVAPGDVYYPRAYVLPRRLGLRFGVQF